MNSPNRAASNETEADAAVAIAPVVAFLASPAGHRINRQTIRVNGGVV